MAHEKANRASALLLAGMIAGVAAAGWSVMRGGAGLPDDAVARVGERLILRADWQRAVNAVASERRTPLTAADRRQILARLVDEELLVQHGLALGLVEQDRRLRGQLVADVMAAAAAIAPAPDEPALRAWYDAHRDYFATPGRLRVRAVRADGGAASPPLPDALLTPAKLREYLGPSLTEAALQLAPGEDSAPLGPQRVVLRVLEREPAATPPFEAIREDVRASALRAAEEQAVRELLASLREVARVAVRPDLE